VFAAGTLLVGAQSTIITATGVCPLGSIMNGERAIVSDSATAVALESGDMVSADPLGCAGLPSGGRSGFSGGGNPDRMAVAGGMATRCIVAVEAATVTSCQVARWCISVDVAEPAVRAEVMMPGYRAHAKTVLRVMVDCGREVTRRARGRTGMACSMPLRPCSAATRGESPRAVGARGWSVFGRASGIRRHTRAQAPSLDRTAG